VNKKHGREHREKSQEVRMGKTLTAGVLIGFFVTLAPAQTSFAAEFYRGKRMQMIVSSPPGGGYDLYSRILARHITRHIPGNPSMIVQNMPGGGHLIATRYLYGLAKRDGLTIASLSRSIPNQEIFMGQGEAKYRSAEFSWLGSVTAEVQVCAVRHDTPVKTLDDLKAVPKPVAMGGQGRGIEPSDYARLLREVFKANVRVIDGYTGTGPRRVALDQGELEGVCGWSWTSVKGTSQEWLDKGFIRLIAQIGMRPHPELTERKVPFLLDLAPDESSRRLMEVLFSRLAIGRPFLAPPGLPKERLQLLRAAFDKTMKDPAFLTETGKLGLEVDPMGGEEVEKLLKRVFNYPPEILKRATQVAMESP
jgi:tripartite-type tricarboxylate transporter receptor subunit TctC